MKHLVRSSVVAIIYAVCLSDPLGYGTSSAVIAPAAKANGRIAFASDRTGNYEIYVMNADGSSQTRVTNSSADDRDPDWSPDGRKIVFSSGVAFSNNTIYTVNADGSNQSALTDASSDNITPAWSPDGTKIAFASDRDGRYQIYVMNADGSSPVKLTSNSLDNASPAWSPDGMKIAFEGVDAADVSDVYVVNTGGGAATNITNNPADDISPTWSPENQKIAFASDRDGNYEIYVTNTDGSGQMRTTNNAADDIYPAWSPDNTKIAFVRGDFAAGASSDIYLMNADGANQQNISNNPLDDVDPAWQSVSSSPNPTPTPAPTATPTPSPSPTPATGEVQAEVRTWTLGGTTQAFVKVTFPNDSYIVANWGQVASNGTNFTADSQVTRSAVNVSVPLSTATIYNLGALAAGNYSFTFKANGSTLLTQTFTVNATPPAANSIDTARTFVLNQYVDFLSREPDGPGWDFWTGEITTCGADAACLDRKRTNTSGAFFLSSEFQATGYFVYRVYKGALNRRPRFVEFLPEVRQVAAGIVVGNALSPQVIDANKRAFALSFVGRDEFRREYPEAMSSADFVNRMLAKTGAPTSAEERAALVAELDSGAGTQAERRARVLYRVVDGTRSERSATNAVDVRQVFETSYGRAFYDAEYNPAFVQMQYFGYLRRDPDESGYQFWLAKLNRFGNFTDAEMVKAFIVSAEYRSRFGQP